MNSDRIAIVSALATQKALYAADDQDVAIVVKYVGAQVSGTIQVAAAAEMLLFKHGALGAEIADVAIQIGATPGSIDVSNAAGNTLGEVVDHINASGNWEAKLVDALRADVPNAAGTSFLIMAATQAKTTAGVKLVWDTSVDFNLTKCISAVAFEVQKGADGNPWSPDETDYINSLISWEQLSTYGAGTTAMQIYEVDRATKRETLLIQKAAAATTVVGTKDYSAVGNGWGLCAAKGCDLVVRQNGSAAGTGHLEVVGASRKFGY
jgi:hypothetical protein